MKILYVIFVVWVFISGVSFARTECSVKSDKILNIHCLNECDFKIHLYVSSDEWCNLVVFIHPKDKSKKISTLDLLYNIFQTKMQLI